MKTRSLTKTQVEAEPFQVWNSFVDLLATEDYEVLSSEQRPAYLVFWYESEVQNGGHFQYFENHKAKYLKETIEALDALGAKCQQQVLCEAGEVWLSRLRPQVETTKEFCEEALESEFDSYDLRFHACLPNLQKVLEDYLSRNQSWFVEVR